MYLDVKELLKKFDNSIDLEDHEYVTFNGVNYAFNMHDEEDVVDEGKFRSGANIYELIICEDNKEIETGIFIRQGYSKYGDYWSGYDFDYDELVQVEQKQKTITYWSKIKN